MSKVATIRWQGKEEVVERLRLSEAPAYFKARERIATGETDADKIEACLAVLGLLRCPQAFLEDATITELGELFLSVEKAHLEAEGPPLAGSQGPVTTSGA